MHMEDETCIVQDQFAGACAIILENARLRAIVLPEHGGKIASLFYKEKQFELLFQNPKPFFGAAKLGATFEQFEACGFDDVFPSVNAEDVPIGHQLVNYPDHGELWTCAMKSKIEGKQIVLACESKILPFRFTKKITLEGMQLKQNYTIEHTGTRPFPFVFLLHCLVKQRKGMRLVVPAGEKQIVGQGERMGKWYLAEKVSEGRCGYIFDEERMCANFVYDSACFPYLGYWYTDGGFRGDHNCALEPASAYYDGVSIAKSNNRQSILTPTETISTTVHLSLQSFEDLEELTHESQQCTR